MAFRLFAERLNQELSKIDVPENQNDRITALSKLLHVPKFKAGEFLSGSAMPDATVLSQLASELEVDEDWLVGRN